MQQVCRWLPGRRRVLVVDGGFAAVALACVKQQLGMLGHPLGDGGNQLVR
jgi:hypothetical protein